MLIKLIDMKERIHDEVDSLFQDKDKSYELTEEDTRKLPYIDQVLNEGLRMTSIAFTARTCTRSFQIPDSNFTIEKGMKVIIPIVIT